MDELKQGYSVVAENAKGKYHEVFKYALKGSFKKSAPLFTYDVFVRLYTAIYRRKIIQGYGILNKFEFEENITREDLDELYQKILDELRTVEQPTHETMKLSDVLEELDHPIIKYISRNSVRDLVGTDE